MSFAVVVVMTGASVLVGYSRLEKADDSLLLAVSLSADAERGRHDCECIAVHLTRWLAAANAFLETDMVESIAFGAGDANPVSPNVL